MLPLLLQHSGAARNGNASAELESLDPCTKGKIVARDAGRKTDVVFDARRGAGLSANRRIFHDNGRKSFRSAVDSSRQTGRPGPDHDQITDPVLLDVEIEADRLRKLLRRRTIQHPVLPEDNPEHGAVRRAAGRDAGCVAGIAGVQPAIGNAVTVRKFQQM